MIAVKTYMVSVSWDSDCSTALLKMTSKATIYDKNVAGFEGKSGVKSRETRV